MTKTTICVLIMFTNEEHCIKETLETTLPYAHEYILCDNASTDNTVKVCQDFFKEHHIKGQVFHTTWVNFGHNYSYLYELGARHAESEYLYQIDADDLIHGTMNINDLTADRYLLQFGDTCKYVRGQLFKNKFLWRHYLCIHGYVDTNPKGQSYTTKTLTGDYYIECRHVGSRHHIDEKVKYLRDAALLQQDLSTDLDKQDERRCWFYLGQSYMCAEEYELSIKAYKKRVYMCGWEEEVYYARLQIARCYVNLDNQKYIKAYLDCFEKHPNRAEPLYHLGRCYAEQNNHPMAKKYFKQASKIPYPSHLILFLSKDIYDYLSQLHLAISYYWLKNYNKSYEINRVLLSKSLPDDIRKIVERNKQFTMIHTMV